MNEYEKLGAFYLGARYDLEAGRVTDEQVLYDAKDLTTHGVCVGMTGSGKTGLCMALIEEAAIDGIPVIVIDPKGDMGNLLLTFPELQPADFRPWIDEGEALRKGLSPEDCARQTAERWRSGLAQWHQNLERITRLQQAAEALIFTPGSNAGVPLTVLRSFDAPSSAVLADAEAMQARIGAAVEGLLALLGIQADPLQSREHILLANVFYHCWSQGQSLDLAGLIRAVQSPPFDQIGVFDLESFFPASERFALAMRINNLLASPGFAVWLEGQPLEISRLLYAPDGRPRIAVVSIAHLSEAERMFFVTILLNELIAWMRSQPGTSSLRALLYMDEIFGYFPPTAKPPSKKPMLTLLKQARAFGVGVMLATQNPVDLDYKGLANTGTWLIGRLQTERDKLRVLDGLEGAAVASGARFDRSRLEAILSGLGSRVFLLHNVHEDQPVVLHSRWVLSFLRGPMTRAQIETVMSRRGDAAADSAPEPSPPPTSTAMAAVAGPASSKPERPTLPAAVNEYFLPPAQAVGSANRLLYRPVVAANARLHFVSASAKIDHWQALALMAPVPDGHLALSWDEADMLTGRQLELTRQAEPRAQYGQLQASARQPKNYTAWKKALVTYLYQQQSLTLYKCPELKAVSQPGEDEGAFRGRLGHLAHEKRDLAVAKLRQKYERRFATLQDRIQRLEHRLEREKEQYQQHKVQATISIGATLLGAFLGRKVASARNIGRATTAVRGIGRAKAERGDIARARAQLEANLQKLQDLEAQFQAAVQDLEMAMDPAQLDLTPFELRPRKADITIHQLGLLWTPWRLEADGTAAPLY